MTNALYKVYWYVKNFYRLTPVPLRRLKIDANRKEKYCLLYVDYASLADRNIKKVKNREFRCGKENIEILNNLALEFAADFCCLVSRDNPSDRVSYEDLYKTYYVDNGGTDISTLFTMRDFFSEYDVVCICNSSAPSMSVQTYGKAAFLHAIKLSTDTDHFVVGLHGNSHSSPSLKVREGKYPHVVSSFFICRVCDLLDVLSARRFRNEETALRVWGDKYFAIRNFELQLSNSVLSSRGTISIIGPQAFELSQMGGSWPKQDSRLFLNN